MYIKCFYLEQKNPKKNEKASNNQKTTQEKAAKALIIETSPSKPSKNQPELVHSNVTPTAEFFPIHFYDSSESFKAHQQICCTHRKCDLKWITVFKRLQKQCSAKVNFKEGTRSLLNLFLILFTIIYNSKSFLGLQISCPAKKLELSDDIFAVWKCLGTIYGLFCSAESDSDTTQTLWLERLSTLVDSSPSKLDALSRELSRHLAQSDFIWSVKKPLKVLT
jgi:hypothetical protein